MLKDDRNLRDGRSEAVKRPTAAALPRGSHQGDDVALSEAVKPLDAAALVSSGEGWQEMQRRLTSVEAQVDRVLEAQIQSMHYQRTVSDRRHDEVLEKLKEMGVRLDLLEAPDASSEEGYDDAEDPCAALNSRMNAFERMAAASEEALDYCLQEDQQAGARLRRHRPADRLGHGRVHRALQPQSRLARGIHL